MPDQTTTKPKRRFAREPQNSVAAVNVAKTIAGPKCETKIHKVIAMLKRNNGATLAQIVEVTGWQPHTTRAALTGLKKRGHVLTKEKRDGVTCSRAVKDAE